MSQRDPLELHGEANLPSGGVLVVPNRLAFQDLLHFEKRWSGRRLVYLQGRDFEYDPLLRAHLDKGERRTLSFFGTAPDPDLKKALHQCLEEGCLVLFVPGFAHTRPGQTIAVPSAVLAFLTSLGAPVLPLFVDHPEENALSTERLVDIERVVFSFGALLPREAANLANYTEQLLLAGETAFSARPLLKSHLAWEILKGMKTHGRTAELIDGNDGSHTRYDKLLAAAMVLAKRLREETQQKRVGIVLPPGKGGFVANLAVLLAGKVPVNLNFTAGDKAVRSCIEQAGLDRFLTAGPFMEKMSAFPWPERSQLLLLDEVLPKLKPRIAFWLLFSKLLSASALAKLLQVPKQGGSEEAVLLFTSGSAGEPKGVVLSHRNLLGNVNQFGARIDLKARDKVFGSLPLFHSFGCTVTLWYPMIEGVGLVTYPSPLEVARLAELVQEHSVSLLCTTPTFLRGYLRKASKEQLAPLKYVVTGAEKLPTKVAEAFEKRFGKPVLEGYGLTETSPVTNVNLPDPEVPEGSRAPVLPNRRLGSVGMFIPGVAVRITDPDTHQPLPLHRSGMISLRGANIFEGYLGQPERTAAVLRNGWFTTGDLGRVDEDGFLYIEGRLSRFSKIGGEMVPHETVEELVNKVLGHTEDERRIAIVGVPDEAKGEALVLLSSQPDIDLQHLRVKLSEAGIPALWIPKKILVVPEIPILASGKLDIKACETTARDAE